MHLDGLAPLLSDELFQLFDQQPFPPEQRSVDDCSLVALAPAAQLALGRDVAAPAVLGADDCLLRGGPSLGPFAVAARRPAGGAPSADRAALAPFGVARILRYTHPSPSSAPPKFDRLVRRLP